MLPLITLLASLALTTATPSHYSPFHQTTTSTPSCPLIFDGRVPYNASLTDFNSASGGGWNPFNPGYVKGNNLSWSSILLLPRYTPPSRFDAPSHATLPLEVTISDASVFMQQYGFRRAGLQFAQDVNEGSPAAQGVVTLHFSLLRDDARPLNLSHEYLNVWHEAADYSANQFNFQAGTLIDQSDLPADTWKLLDRNNKLVWSTPMLKHTWQNFAITLDFDNNTIQAWYSQGRSPLRAVTEPLDNDNSGQGQYQIGILKKPTGTSDVVNAGFQESPLNEGLIYGGIFIENSADSCVSS